MSSSAEIMAPLSKAPLLYNWFTFQPVKWLIFALVVTSAIKAAQHKFHHQWCAAELKRGQESCQNLVIIPAKPEFTGHFWGSQIRSEEHTSELQSRPHL